MTSWYRKWQDARADKKSRKRGEYIDVEPEQTSSVPPNAKPTGLLRRRSKRDQQLATLQAGYTELLDLIRSIRTHLDNQEEAQTKVLESMDRFNQTLSLMDQTSRKSAQTMSSLARKTLESEDLLRKMVERSERRMVILMTALLLVTVTILGLGLYFGVIMRPSPSVTSEPVVQEAAVVEAALVKAPVPAVDEPAVESEPVQEPTEVEEDEPVTEDIGEDIDLSKYDFGEEFESAEESVDEEDEKPFGGRRGFLFFRRKE